MRKLILFHNPKAGDAEHDSEKIIAALEHNGYEVQYFSMKKDWKSADLHAGIDMLVVAGGDGTSRKLVGWLLETGLISLHIPITILPLGTANNLSKTFGIHGDFNQLIPQWPSWKKVPYDIGIVGPHSEADQHLYFLEAMGCGLFANHLQNSQKGDSGVYKNDPKKKIEADLEKLRKTLMELKPVDVTVMVDDVDYSGNYLLVSVMSSRHLGTNLEFNPGHQPGDGRLQVVLITAPERDLLREFILGQSRDDQKKIQFRTITGAEIRLRSSDHLYHLDDQLYNVTGEAEIGIRAYKEQLSFLAPGDGNNGDHQPQ